MRAPTVLALAALALTACANTTQLTHHGDLTVRSIRASYNNVHLVSQGDHHVLIDSGLPDNLESILEALDDFGVDPAAIGAIVLTHGHADHAGGALHFQKTWGAKIIAGEGDRPNLEAGKNVSKMCPTSDYAEGRYDEDKGATFSPTEADLWVGDAPVSLTDFGIHGQVVPLAGHTAGSLIVVVDDVALIGDLVRGAIVGGGAEVHFYNCDLKDNRADLRALLDTYAPSAKTFYVGHFGPLDREDLEALWEEMGEAE